MIPRFTTDRYAHALMHTCTPYQCVLFGGRLSAQLINALHDIVQVEVVDDPHILEAPAGQPVQLLPIHLVLLEQGAVGFEVHRLQPQEDIGHFPVYVRLEGGGGEGRGGGGRELCLCTNR